MIDVAALAITVPLLILALVVALRGGNASIEALVAVLGATFAVLIGAVGGGPATDEIYDVGPTLIFLCTLLVLSHLADAEGVFAWAAAVLASRAGRSPVALFRRVFILAAVTTAVLNLDATVVLLTPIVVATVRRMRLTVKPHAYACSHLANSASLLMPVSNLTNLLAFAATGLSFLAFTGLMAAPWLVAVGVEYLVLRRAFAPELIGVRAEPATDPPPMPQLALTVVALTITGFAVGSLFGVAPVWPAAAGAAVLAARRLITGRSSFIQIVESANVSFALFVLGLAVIVRGIQENGLGQLISGILPDDAGLGSLLLVATIAAILANVVNNIPATLALVPVAAMIGTPAILAVLIGVNVGSNLTYVGSLANLLWRRVLAPYDEAPSAWSFTGLGLLTVPVTLVASTTALWVSWRIFG